MADEQKDDAGSGRGCGCAFVGLVGFVFFYPFLSAFSAFPPGWNMEEVYDRITAIFEGYWVIFAVVFALLLIWGLVVAFKSGELTAGQLLAMIATTIVVPFLIQWIFGLLF